MGKDVISACDFASAEAVYTFLDREIFLKVHKLDRHQASGRILGIAEQMIDVSSRLGIGICKKLLNKSRRHLLHKVGSIIRHKVVDDVCGLSVGKCRYDLLFDLDRKECKNISRYALGKYTENLDLFLMRKFLKNRRDIGFIPFNKLLSESGILLFFNKFQYLIHSHSLFHTRSSFPLIEL